MSARPSDYTQTVREQFPIQPARFEQHVEGLRNRATGQWVVKNLGLTGNQSVLGVATRTGFMSRIQAPHVPRVSGMDVTPEMLQKARDPSVAAGLGNTTFGDATAHPYPDDQIDMAISRNAVRLSANPRVELEETSRSGKPDAKVVMVDITTSDDPERAAAHYQLERPRDPSHTIPLPLSGLNSLTEQSALRIVRSSQDAATCDLHGWVDRTSTPDDIRGHFAAAVEAQLARGDATGMHVRRRDDRLNFAQHSAVPVCGTNKPGAGSG
jgi:hypothetical protein